MDPLQNPFSPGAGFPPPELAGRQNLLDRSKIVLGRFICLSLLVWQDDQNTMLKGFLIIQK